MPTSAGPVGGRLAAALKMLLRIERFLRQAEHLVTHHLESVVRVLRAHRALLVGVAALAAVVDDQRHLRFPPARTEVALPWCLHRVTLGIFQPMPKRTPTPAPKPPHIVAARRTLAAVPTHFDGVPVIPEEEALKRGFTSYAPVAAVITPTYTPPPAPKPPPIVDMAALITAERVKEQAACAAFVESLDVGSESIRNAIAKAIRERK